MEIKKIINQAGLKIKKYSPEILMVAGIVGTVTAAVTACKATLKVKDVMSEKEELQNVIHENLENPDVDYTEEDSKEDLTKVYAQTGVKLIKLYAPSVALGGVSIASIVMGQKILKKRNIALAAAYTAIDKGFKKYRANVVERFGERVDKELRYNIKAKEVEKKITDKNGKEKTVKEIQYDIEGNPLENISEFARFFDEATSTEHHKDAEYNLMFLRRQQDYANEVLKAKGHLFLNDVYEMLGIPKTKAGQIVGWIYDEKNPNGDNFVDFGIYRLSGNEVYDERKRAFVNGYERNILLDFNVDGPIYELI